MSFLSFLKTSWDATANDVPDAMLEFASDVELTAKEGKPVQVSILAYTGGVMSPSGWGAVVIDLAGLELTASFPLLADHDSSLKGVLGHGTATVQHGKLFARGTITRTTESAQKIIELSRDGFRFQSSVGVSPIKVERIKEEKTITANGREHKAPSGGMWLVKAAKLREITITALGADDQTDVAIAASKGNDEMTLAASGQTSTINTSEIIQAERDRIKKIESVCDNHDWGTRRGQVNALRAKAIDGEIEIETLQASLLDIMRGSRPTAPMQARNSGGEGGGYGYNFCQKHMEACLLLRSGHEKSALEAYGQDIVSQAGEIRHRSILELTAMLLQSQGQTVPRNPNDLLKATAFSSLGTMTETLGNTMNRVLLSLYKEAPATWRSFAASRTTDNFKENTSIRPSFVDPADQVGPHGELKHGTIQESVFKWSVDTYGKMFTVSRKTLIDDDLGFLDELPLMMTNICVQKLSDLVWETLFANAGSYFSAGNTNLQTGAGSDLSLASLETSVLQMRKRTDSEGNDLDIRPRTLIVPPELEVTAKNLLHSIEIQAAEGIPTGNALKDIVNLEVEPRISNTKFSGSSPNQWYLFGGLMDVPVVVGFLNGQESPTVEFFGLDHSVNTLAFSWRCYQDFGVALGDNRAAQKSTGA